MKEFRDQVAVVTGAASGIGRALVDRFAAEGMKIVLADIEVGALAKAKSELEAMGAEVLAVATDVSKPEEIEALAAKTLAAFGAVHLVCNNAGVAATGPLWERSLADYEWVLGVNLWGVIHGIRTFVPILLDQDTGGHIVNTASLAGLTIVPGNGIYQISKHGVVALSESLHFDLAQRGAKVRVSVLCPSFVRTAILDSERNRPAHLAASQEGGATTAAGLPEELVRQLIASGLEPTQVAQKVFEAIRDEKFWILTHPEAKHRIRDRMEAILEDRNPEFSLGAALARDGFDGR